jgi:cellulose synthase/poly-beta-1,6-N-acetylglucosamine synthase-like glycosyltransferase
MLVSLARRHAKQGLTSGLAYSPPVSVIVPAFNEELGIAATVRSLCASDYPDFAVIVVDDGSTDATASEVSALGDPCVSIVRQANAGKPAALNTGIARSSGEIVVTVDADTVVEPDVLARLVRPFWNRRVGATSGNTKVANRSGLLGRWQHLEYVMGLNLDRRMFHMLGCVPTVPGAVGAFRRSALVAIGGFSDDTLAEDTDATMAIHRRGYQVFYVDDAVAWTEAPSSLGDLWRQRYRWSYGTIQSIVKHLGAAVERRARRLGLIGLPYLVLFQVLLALLAPLIDVFFVFGLVFLNPWPILGYWAGFNLLQLALASYALHLDRERIRVLWALPLQQIVYRQLMYLVVIQSVISALLGTRLRWQRAQRTGATTEPATLPDATPAA